MALLEMSFQSDVLGFEQQLAVILPDPRALKLEENGAPDTDDLTVLYLLHGYHGNHLDWTRYTMLERFVEESRKKIAVVMPSGLTYYYADMARGWKYFTYIAEEVPLLAKSYFHISAKPENTHVAGLSMGGAGSVKLALTYPERYATVSSFSGALDPVGRANKIDVIAPERAAHYNNIYGDDKQAVRRISCTFWMWLPHRARSCQKSIRPAARRTSFGRITLPSATRRCPWATTLNSIRKRAWGMSGRSGTAKSKS